MLALKVTALELRVCLAAASVAEVAMAVTEVM